jgi:hypothetical protein
MHAMLVRRDTLLVFRTHFIPLLCVFYTLFTQTNFIAFQTNSEGIFFGPSVQSSVATIKVSKNLIYCEFSFNVESNSQAYIFNYYNLN